MASAEEYFRSIPPVTKVYFVGAIATTVLVSLGALNPYYLYLDFNKIFYSFQIWRFVTCFFFFGKFSFQWLFQIVLLVRYFRLLEESYYPPPKSTPDFILLVAFCAILLIIIGFLGDVYFPGPALIFSIIYIWSRKDPFADVVFYGFAFKAWHTPFLFLLLAVLMGGVPILDIIGIVIGHVYHFCYDIVPNAYRRTIIWTPQWLVKLVQGRELFTPVTPAWAQRGGGHRLN